MIFDVGKLQLLQFLWLRLVGVEIHRYALPDEYLPGKLLLSFDSDISLNRELASLNTGHQARNRGIIKRNQIVAVHVCELAHPDNTYSPKAIANYIVNMTK
jgi:hypothetical protein